MSMLEDRSSCINVSEPAQDTEEMDNPSTTMEEYVQYETEKAIRNGKVYKWETTKYGKINYIEENNEKHEKKESCEDAWKNYLHNDEGINGDSNATQVNQEGFKAMDVNDGLGNSDDYLILYDDPHYVEKEERRFKECSTIIDYEQDILLQPNKSMSQAYERIFR
ncbi:hypothetical protein Tco_0962182 [Tanacetum coccineum]